MMHISITKILCHNVTYVWFIVTLQSWVLTWMDVKLPTMNNNVEMVSVWLWPSWNILIKITQYKSRNNNRIPWHHRLCNNIHNINYVGHPLSLLQSNSTSYRNMVGYRCSNVSHFKVRAHEWMTSYWQGAEKRKGLSTCGWCVVFLWIMESL